MTTDAECPRSADLMAADIAFASAMARAHKPRGPVAVTPSPGRVAAAAGPQTPAAPGGTAGWDHAGGGDSSRSAASRVGPKRSRRGSETRRRSQQVNVRLTPVESIRLAILAHSANMTVAEYLRNTALQGGAA